MYGDGCSASVSDFHINFREVQVKTVVQKMFHDINKLLKQILYDLEHYTCDDC